MKDAFTLATSSGVPSATIWPPPIATIGAKVDDPVGGLDDVQIVLNDQHGIALVDETLQHRQQAADVLEVKASGRFVEQVDRVTG